MKRVRARIGAPRKGTTVADRFSAQVAPPDARGCRLWLTSQHDREYGRFMLDGKRDIAHRVAWILANGPIPDGLHVLHNCDVPRCVEVAHLRLGTNAENMADRDAKARQARGSRNGGARLTEAAVVEIRAQIAGGLSQTAIAARFGVTRSAVSKIATGRMWASVPCDAPQPI